MARLSNSALRRQQRAGTRRQDIKEDGAWLILDAARNCGDRGTANRVRRVVGA